MMCDHLLGAKYLSVFCPFCVLITVGENVSQNLCKATDKAD